MEAMTIKEERVYQVQDPEAAVAIGGISRVLIGGMDGAGKSTLSCSLYLYLQERGFDVSLHEIDPWSDTHDPILGRKPWSERQKRSDVTPAEYAEYVAHYADDRAEIVIGDMQGRSQSETNHMLAGLPDIGILITRDTTNKDKVVPFPQYEYEWQELYERLKVPLDIKVRSLLAHQDYPEGYFPVWGLEREPVPNDNQIQKLGQRIIELARSNVTVESETLKKTS